MSIPISSFSRDAAFFLQQSVSPSLTHFQRKIIFIASIALASIAAFFVACHYFRGRSQKEIQADKKHIDDNTSNTKVGDEGKTSECNTTSKIEQPSPEIVEKPIAEIVPPLGFTNYGQSCWMASGLQMLFACDRFRTLARSPLERATYEVMKQEDPDKWIFQWMPHTETDDQLQARKNVQTALVRVIDAWEKGERDALDPSIQHLHATIMESRALTFENLSPLPAIGQTGNELDIIRYLQDTLKCNAQIMHSYDIPFFLIAPSASLMEKETSESLSDKQGLPEIIILDAQHMACPDVNRDKLIDLSNFALDGKNRPTTELSVFLMERLVMPPHIYASKTTGIFVTIKLSQKVTYSH